MKIFRYVLYTLIGIPVCIILVWLIAVPMDLIHERLEDSITSAGNTGIKADVKGLKKGILLSLHADAIDLSIDKRPALSITDLSFSFSPGHLINGEFAFLVKGSAANGTINGTVKLPVWGKIKIDHAELGAIPYITRFGLDINGNVFSNIKIEGNAANVIFNVPDLSIGDDSTVIPLLNTFRRLQGSLSLRGNTVKIRSVSLEGEKGYARLKGSITNGIMDLTLELMPDTDKLKAMESMLIGKYIISPGYYEVPIKGPLP